MTLSPAALRICHIAVEHFSERGYDGSSLNDVAELAGMRKASLYSHFKNKDDLVENILAMTLEHERAFASEAFGEDAGALPGKVYLDRLGDRFDTSAELRFLLRTAYAPPIAIRESIVATYATFNDHVRELFTSRLSDDIAHDVQTTLTEGYLGAVDAVQVELLYGESATLEPRRQALWSLLTSYAEHRRT
jgi:AcrR family transcriptional regulator